jgi:ribonuclease HI
MLYSIFTDSSIEPVNPGGLVSWAFIVRIGKKVVHEDTEVSVHGGEFATNNVGEFHAVVAAMLWLLKLPKEKRFPVIINSDSQLIVNQCQGVWDCRDPKLVPLRDMVIKAKKKYGRNVTFHWIPREKNTEADALSRTAYDEKELAYFREHQLDILFNGDDIPF